MPLLPSSPTTVDVAAAFLPPPEIVKAIERLGISKVAFIFYQSLECF